MAKRRSLGECSDGCKIRRPEAKGTYMCTLPLVLFEVLDHLKLPETLISHFLFCEEQERDDLMLKTFSSQVSWTTALRQIVVNCYKYHGRDDLLPAFNEDDEKTQVRRV